MEKLPFSKSPLVAATRSISKVSGTREVIAVGDKGKFPSLSRRVASVPCENSNSALFSPDFLLHVFLQGRKLFAANKHGTSVSPQKEGPCSGPGLRGDECNHNP
eukprot:scaffold689_cov186-Amphora_coffeaeformis.AAC.2